jgi:hypothetical protein
MVGFDPIVRVLAGVVERGGDQLLDNSSERPGAVRDHFGRRGVSAQCRQEELPRGSSVAPRRDVDINDLATQTEPQRPPDRENDHLSRKPEARER